VTEQSRAQGVLQGERGTILVIGLVGTFVATLLAIALFDLGVLQSRVQRDNVCTRRALHAAEAGLLRAYQDIERAAPATAMHFTKLAPAGGGGTLTTSLSSLGSAYTAQQLRSDIPDQYSVQARIVPSTGPRIIRLVSTGRLLTTCRQEAGSGGVATVQADLARESSPIGAPFVGKDSIQMKSNGASTDSYNSFVGKYTTSSCPQYDAKGNPINKVVGCGGDLWTDGTAPIACDKATTGALCMKDGATVFGNITASSNAIYVLSKKDKGTGAIWGNASYDPTDSGSLTCTTQPGCVSTTDPSKSIVQGSIVAGSIPPIQLTAVTACPTDPTDTPSAAGYSSGTWLNTKVAVTDDMGNPSTCSSKGKFCAYDDSTGNLTISDKSKSLIVNQGQYCLNAVNVKAPMQLQYDPTPSKVLPVQLSVKGPVKFDDKVAKGTTVAEHENSPWLFMVLSSCSSATGCTKTGIEMKIGAKSKDGTSNDGLYGYLYAPSAPIKLNDDGDMFGAVVGRQLSFDKADLHFDQALLNLVEICPTCVIPPYLIAKPVDTLSNWRRCVAPAGGECP
jgi:hypothetical protein